MPTIALATFIKNSALSQKAKESAYRRYLTPGGYDFYWQLKAEARAFALDGKSRAQCEEALQNIKNTVRRKHSLSGFTSLMSFLEKEDDLSFFDPPAAVCKTPKGHLAVRVAPELGLIKGKMRRVVSIWNTQVPALNQHLAGIGIHLLIEHIRTGEFSDVEC